MYEKLFTPLQIGGFSLKNRITRAPMYLAYAAEGGTVSEKMLQHYERLSLGGAALIVTEAAAVHESGLGSQVALRVDDDRYIEGLSTLAETIRENGAIPAMQIFHAGRYARVAEPIAASSVPFTPKPDITITPREMSEGEVSSMVNSFAQAAKRAKDAGFQMIELHGATGYLIVQFVSPRTNKRTDSYGGNFENRIRFPLELLRACKGAAGEDFPVGYRLMADEWLPDGFQLEEGKELARRLEQEGIAYLSVTAGTYESWSLPEIQELSAGEGFQAHIGGEIKEAVSNVPVFICGRITTPGLADDILTSGKADAVALARPLFADPHFPRKAMEGREEEIVRCQNAGLCMATTMKDKGAVCKQWGKS